jgi:hypothetical protein
MAHGRVVVVSAAALLLAGACGGGLRLAPAGPHTEDAVSIPVHEAPPPAKVEDVPPDPGEPCVWLDGYWDYLGRSWEWRAGRWVVPPAGCYYAPPEPQWTTDGLYYYRGQWYSESTRGACAKARSCNREDGSEPATEEPQTAIGR